MPPTRLLWRLIILAHEVGHVLSALAGWYTDELDGAYDAVGWQRQDARAPVTPRQKGLVLDEERRAWDFAVDVLEELRTRVPEAVAGVEAALRVLPRYRAGGLAGYQNVKV